MSDFSDLMKQYMDEASLSAYQLSQLCGIERTTIYRVSRGTRRGSEEFVETVAPYLQLSKNEKQALLDALRMEKIGKNTYENRIAIQDLLFKISNWKQQENLQNTDVFMLQNIDVSFRQENPVVVLNSENEVDLCIISMLQAVGNMEKSPEVFSTAWKKMHLVQAAIWKIGKSTQKYLPFFQYIQFEKTTPEKVVSKNMKMVNEILPFAVAYPGKYEVYYSYAAISEDKIRLFPYCIVVDKYVLYMAEDYQKGLLVCIPEFAQTIREEMKRIRNQYVCLMHRKLIYGDDYVAFGKQESIDFCFAEYLPIDFFIDETLAEEVVDPNFKDEFGVLYWHSKMCRKNAHHFFSESSLKQFLKNPQDLHELQKFQIQVNEQIFQKMVGNVYQRLTDQNKNIHVLKKDTIPTVPGLAIGLKRHKKLIIVNETTEKNRFCISITEQSVCNAFEDFFETLSQSEVLLSAEEKKYMFSHWIN